MIQKYLKNWKGTVNRPIISATKTTPGLSYFQESDRNYIALENKSGSNYIEWKGTVEEFKEAIKNLTGKPTAASTPKTSSQSTTSQKDGWSGSSYYQNGTKVTSKWIFDKNYNSYFYLDASGNFVQNSWVGTITLNQVVTWLRVSGFMIRAMELIIT